MSNSRGLVEQDVVHSCHIILYNIVDFFLFSFIKLYFYTRFASLYICAPLAFLVITNPRSWHRIAWNSSYR